MAVEGENMTEEHRRVEASAGTPETWRLWGPYLAERAWGTVREDTSPDGSAWDSFPHDDARRRAYRWSEDGLGGICDIRQFLCFAPAFWNGRDPILKERLFGAHRPGGKPRRGCQGDLLPRRRDAPATAS